MRLHHNYSSFDFNSLSSYSPLRREQKNWLPSWTTQQKQQDESHRTKLVVHMMKTKVKKLWWIWEADEMMTWLEEHDLLIHNISLDEQLRIEKTYTKTTTKESIQFSSLTQWGKSCKPILNQNWPIFTTNWWNKQQRYRKFSNQHLQTIKLSHNNSTKSELTIKAECTHHLSQSPSHVNISLKLKWYELP